MADCLTRCFTPGQRCARSQASQDLRLAVPYLIAEHGGRYRLILLLLTSTPFLTGIILRVTATQQILGPIGTRRFLSGGAET